MYIVEAHTADKIIVHEKKIIPGTYVLFLSRVVETGKNLTVLAVNQKKKKLMLVTLRSQRVNMP